MYESHVGHLSRFRLKLCRVLAVDDREMNVIVHVNVFDPHPQACCITANVTDRSWEIAYHQPTLLVDLGLQGATRLTSGGKRKRLEPLGYRDPSTLSR